MFRKQKTVSIINLLKSTLIHLHKIINFNYNKFSLQ